MAEVSVNFPKFTRFIEQCGLARGGLVQQFIDAEIARLSDPYVPSDTTGTRKSVFRLTNFGSGKVVYQAYGKEGGRTIWNDTRDTVKWQDAPRRGPFWVLRMWEAGGRDTVMAGVRRLLKKHDRS